MRHYCNGAFFNPGNFMNEKEIIVDGVAITYRYKPRKYDTRHAIFIFSGFGGKSQFTYDFENALNDCLAHIFWIKDDFSNNCAYYLAVDMDFKIEKAINKFIANSISELGLDKENVTLAGFSKGGSAALYYGFKYNYQNIVVTVPQFNIGTYITNNWKNVAANMLCTGDLEEIKILDNLLPDLIVNDNFHDKNIYLLTSESDPQFSIEIKPNLPKFFKFNNFNLLMSESILVRGHSQVTSHHVTLLLGILYCLSQGVYPRFGFKKIKGDRFIEPKKPSAEPIAILRKVELAKDKIYPEGVSFLRGIPCAEYKDIHIVMIFRSSKAEFEYKIAKAHKPSLTREFYDGEFVNYDKAWFCSYQYSGVDISSLPKDKYKIFIKITCGNLSRTTELVSDKKNNDRILASFEGVKVSVSNNEIIMEN